MRMCSWVTLCFIVLMMTACRSAIEKRLTMNESGRPSLRLCEQSYLCFNTTPIYDAVTLTCRCEHFAHKSYTNKDDEAMYTVTSQPKPTDCYTMSGRFHLYKGTRNVSRTGLPCARWAEVNTERKFEFHTGETALEAENYCRVRKSTYELLSAPWCYVFAAREKTWEYCDIDSCDSFNGDDCFTITERGGKDIIVYNGTTSTSVSGYTCKPWESDKQFTSGESTTEAANYCRVVVGDRVDVPWCYTDRGDWEVCNVRLCSGRQRYIH